MEREKEKGEKEGKTPLSLSPERREGEEEKGGGKKKGVRTRYLSKAFLFPGKKQNKEGGKGGGGKKKDARQEGPRR